jgi:hypothetical protein
MTILRATIFETLPRAWKHPSSRSSAITSALRNPSQSAPFTQSSKVMASPRQINASQTLDDIPISDAVAPENPADYEIENTDVKTAPGVTLSATQKLLTGSVLDVGFDFRSSKPQTKLTPRQFSCFRAVPRSRNFLCGKTMPYSKILSPSLKAANNIRRNGMDS